jgi:hypothetical protein
VSQHDDVRIARNGHLRVCISESFISTYCHHKDPHKQDNVLRLPLHCVNNRTTHRTKTKLIPRIAHSRMPSLISVTNAIRAALALRPARKSSSQLQKDLAHAVRAEAPPPPAIWTSHPYKNLLLSDNGLTNVGDGVFICSSCRAENILIHFKGDHPFKYLRCRVCEHVFCAKCPSSRILQAAVVRSLRGCELQAGCLCPRCGLSHRAVLRRDGLSFDVNCPCGNMYDSSWVRFSIGGAVDYRRDPLACANKLKLRKSLQRCFTL